MKPTRLPGSVKTYGPITPRRHRTYKVKTVRLPKPSAPDHSGTAFLAVVLFVVLFGLSILFRYINPDPTIHHAVDPNAPVIERPTFHEIK